MFFEVKFLRNVRLLPRHLGTRLKSILNQSAKRMLDGRFVPTLGQVIVVTNVGTNEKGVIDDLTQCVDFLCEVTAVVFHPFPNEVVDGIVVNVTNLGVNVLVGGCCPVFVSARGLGTEFRYIEDKAVWTKSDDRDPLLIKLSEKLRIRITGVRIDATGYAVQGTMAEDYLGRIE